MFSNKVNILLVIIGSIISSCAPEVANEPYWNENGLLIEKVGKFNFGEDPYIVDNKIYTDRKVFSYRYFYLTPTGDTMHYRSTPTAAGVSSKAQTWDLVPLDSTDEKTVIKISYTVIKGLQPFIYLDAAFNKTVVEIRNYNTVGAEVDSKDINSLVENAGNVWLPQPHFKLFRLLELNPFPFIQMPLEIGHKWQWTHDISEWWSDPQWGSWGGNVRNVCDYEIIGKEILQTPLGTLDCWIVQGKTASNLGKSAIKAYFHEQYGFVKMEYENVNKSKLVQELEKVTQ